MWWHLALCQYVDPELFFPAKSANPHAAKAICASCPVRADCGEYAVHRPDITGVWGGLTDRERQRLRNRRPLLVS